MTEQQFTLGATLVVAGVLLMVCLLVSVLLDRRDLSRRLIAEQHRRIRLECDVESAVITWKAWRGTVTSRPLDLQQLPASGFFVKDMDMHMGRLQARMTNSAIFVGRQKRTPPVQTAETQADAKS